MSPQPTEARCAGLARCAVPGRQRPAPAGAARCGPGGHGDRGAQRAGRRLRRLDGDAPDRRRAGQEPGRRLGRRGAHARRRPPVTGSGPPAATTSTPTPSCACSWRTSSPAVRSRASTWSCSVRSGARAAPRAACAPRPRWTPRSVPAALRKAVEGGENGLAWTYTRIRYSPPTGGSTPEADQPGVAVGLDGGAALRRGHLRAVLPVPDGGGAADAAAAAPACCSPPACCSSLLVAGVAAARHPPGDHPGAAGPARRRADRLGPPRGADARRGRGRHRPPRHLVQPDGRGACSPRSASWWSSRGCSARSSPTSPTSCAPR